MRSIHFSPSDINTHLKMGRNVIAFERYWIGFLECEWQPIHKPEPSIAFDVEVVEWAQLQHAMMARTRDRRNQLIYTVHITHIQEYGSPTDKGSRVLLPLRFWDVTTVDGQTTLGDPPQTEGRQG